MDMGMMMMIWLMARAMLKIMIGAVMETVVEMMVGANSGQQHSFDGK